MTTTDHDEIRRWVEARGGRPAIDRGVREDEANPLRFAFPDAPDAESEGLEPISWDEWFRRFDRDDFALLIEETTSDGRQSHFSKLVNR